MRVVSRRNSQSVSELRPRDFAHDLFPDRTRRTNRALDFVIFDYRFDCVSLLVSTL